MSSPPPSKPKQPPLEATPRPELPDVGVVGAEGWDAAIDSWSASLGRLDSVPAVAAETETTPAPLAHSHPVARPQPLARPNAEGRQPDSGLIRIPDLAELSAAYRVPRKPVPEESFPHTATNFAGEPEDTEPRAQLPAEPEDVLLGEDIALDEPFDPFADPVPPDKTVPLEQPEPAPQRNIDAFVTTTSWQDVSAPSHGPTAAYREERLAFLMAELESRQTLPAQEDSLAWVALEAARAAEAAGLAEHVQPLVDRACQAAPQAVAPRRERLRLFNGREQTSAARVQSLAKLLDEVSERAGKQREAYEKLAYSLRVVGGQVPPGERGTNYMHRSAGLCLLLARAATQDRDAHSAAAALAQAGQALQGELGAELLFAGARLLELRGFGDRGSAMRSQAQALWPHASAQVMATLRLIGGFSAADTLLSAQTLLPTLPDATLRRALGQWASDLAELNGDAVLAADILDSVVDGEPLAALSLSERMALLPLRLQDVVENPEGWVEALDPAASALLLSTASEMTLRLDQVAEALALLEAALALCPNATFAALLAERIAQSLPAGPLRLRALALWAAGDPARMGIALSETADEAASMQDDAHVQRAQDAACDALSREGIALQFVWNPLPAGKSARGIRLLSLAAEQFHAMGETGIAAALQERAEDLKATDVPTRAVMRAMARSSSAEETMDHPRVLALAPLERAKTPSAIAAVYRSAAMSSRQVNLRVLEAIAWMKAAEQRKQAVQFLQSRWSGGLPSAGVAMLMRMMANIFDDAESAAAIFERLATTSRNVDHEAFWLFRRAEALSACGRDTEAAQVLRDLGPTSLQVEADVAYHRMLWAGEAFAGLDGILRDEADGLLGVGLAERAARTMLTRAQVRAEALADLHGASTLLGEALAVHAHTPSVAAIAMVTAALLGEGANILAGLEALAISQDPDAAFLRLLVAEGQQDTAGVSTWLTAALDSPERIRLSLLQRVLGPGAGPHVWQQALHVVQGRETVDVRLSLALKMRAAEALARTNQMDAALALLDDVMRADPQHLPALRLAARVARASGRAAEMASPLREAAALCQLPRHQSRLYLEAAQSQLAVDATSAQELLEKALHADPGNQEAFSQLRARLERQQNREALADALRVRLRAPLSADESRTLRLERAGLLAKAADRAGAKSELRALLIAEPQNAAALNQLVELEYQDGAFSIAAELYLRLARLQSEPSVQVQIFRRLGRIYHKKLSDSKLASGAYERVLKLAPDDMDALAGLSEIYNKQNDLPRAIAVTERALAVETEARRRLIFQLRLAGLHEKNGQPQLAGNLLRRAVELAPRSLQAIGEMARYYERHKDVQARRVLLDTSLSRLHHDLRVSPGDLSALRAIVPVLRWSSRAAGSAATAQLLAALTEDLDEEREMRAWAVPPLAGRRLTPLANPDVDEMAYPQQLPPGLRQVMRVLGPPLSKVNKPVLALYGLSRAERLAAGEGPRAIFDGLAADLGVRNFEVYVSRSVPGVLAVEPGDPAAIILGSDIVERGAVAVRFAAGYALRLVATHFDLLAAPDPGGAALLVALVQQFVQLPGQLEVSVDPEQVAAAAARLARVLGRGLRTELRPFVAEMASPSSLSNVASAVEETAARVGLLACGDLAVALQVLMAKHGLELSASTLASVPVASALFDFSLSADYELLVRSLDSIS